MRRENSRKLFDWKRIGRTALILFLVLTLSISALPIRLPGNGFGFTLERTYDASMEEPGAFGIGSLNKMTVSLLPTNGKIIIMIGVLL